MAAPYAFPVSNILPDGDHAIGTMFLVRHGGLFLVGAAHSPTRLQPHRRWAEWPSEFQFWVSPTENISLPLFTADFLRVPLFRFERRDDFSDNLQDMMALPVSEAQFGHLPSINLASGADTVAVGTPVAVYGFPDRPELPKWPYAPAKVATGIVQSVEPHLVFCGNMASEVGHSGGPVFADDGRLVGMLIGHEHDGRRTVVPTAALLRLMS